MEIEGNQILNFSLIDSWHKLLNVNNLVKISTNVKSVHQISDDVYKVTAELSFGNLSNLMEVLIHITDKNEPYQFKVNIFQDGKFGIISAFISIKLTEVSTESTHTFYHIKLKLPFLFKSLVGNKMKDVLKETINEFFQKINSKEEV